VSERIAERHDGDLYHMPQRRRFSVTRSFQLGCGCVRSVKWRTRTTVTPIHPAKGRAADLEAREDAVSTAKAGYSERIDDRVRIWEIARALFQHGRTGVVRQGDRVVSIATDGYDAAAQTLRWKLDAPIAGAAVVIELVGYNSVFQLCIDRGARLEESHLVTPLPTRILRVRRRWLRRATVTSPLTVRFRQPSSPTLAVATVHDVSYQGLAFELADGVPPFLVGTRLEGLQVCDGAGNALELTVQVRSLLPLSHGRHLCGVEIVSATDHEDRRWGELVDDQLHPGTRIGSGWARHLWSLYAQCGYFNLSGKTPEQFEQRRHAFLQVSRQLDDSPHLGCHVVWPRPDREGATAALSALKVYERSWLGFQMAKMTGDIDGVPGRKILREIHLRTYEHMQRDPGLAWVIGIPQAKRVWTALVHYDLPRRYIDTGEAAIARFRALEVDCTVRRTLPPSVKVGPATAGERSALCRAVARLRPKPYGEALDLVPERLDLARNRRLWQTAGFTRDRRILVARDRGTATAAAVLEVASDGMHLFGLLDLVRVFPLLDGGEAFYPHLLEAAKAWFAAHGKSRYVCHLEPSSALPDDARAAMVDLGEADLTILAAHRLPELLEHLYEVTAPRAPAP
jgi:hypothetical protein